MTDTAREPRQPRRLEKKRNTWIGSFGTVVTHGMDGAGQDNLPAQRDRRWLSPRPVNRNLSGHVYLAGKPVSAVTVIAPGRSAAVADSRAIVSAV